MSQRLVLPIDDCQLNAGYKAPAYRKEWGYNHYGADLIEVSKYRVLRGMGNGRVVACGMDGATSAQRLGNCTVLVFDDVELNDGRFMPALACRMFHKEKIAVKAGDIITPATILGEYGNTGSSTTGPHLHIEFDTDVQYPQYAYGIKSSGKVIKKGTMDSTIDPCKVFWLAPGQSLTAPAQWIVDGWITKEQLQLPKLPQDIPNQAQEVQRLQDRVEELEALVAKEQAARQTAESKIQAALASLAGE